MTQTDLERVLALPRRTTPPETLARELTEYLSLGAPEFVLYPEQALALLEAHDRRGLIMSARVGAGKTIVMFLIATVCGFKRPMIVVPAHLREKTLREWREHARHWRMVEPLVKSYTEISRDKSKSGESVLLPRLRPDAIICDEAHHLGNLDAGCTRKIMRYLSDQPDVGFYAFTGTLLSSTLMDGWHICLRALGEGSPLPLRKRTCQAWSEAVDPAFDEVVREQKRSALGLDVFGGPDARQGLRAWINDTPGFVTSSTKYDGPLTFERTTIESPAKCRDAIAMAGDGIRPDGLPLDAFDRLQIKHPTSEGDRTGFARWRLAQTLFLGYWDKPDPEPPAEWLISRAEWSAYVAEILGEESGLDTPEAVVYAVEAGRVGQERHRRMLARWRTARDSYKYRTVATWIDPDAPALRYAAEWLARSPHRLAWVPGGSAGRRLAAMSGAGFFGAGQGKPDGNGGTNPFIEDADGNAVLTTGANKSGRNLQFKWRHNLFLATASLSGEHEQTIGRTHRPGQLHPVTVEYVRGLPAHDAAWTNALANAEFVAGLTGDDPKILKGRET